MTTWEDCFTALLEREPRTLEKLCTYVACGGSELDFCEREGVLYEHLMQWIWEEPKRREAFDSAMKMRESWLKEAVVREMRTLALSDIRAAFDSFGNIKPVAEWPAGLAKAIASYTVDEETGKKTLKFWDKGKALEQLAKKLGFFVEKHEHTLGATLEDLIVQSYTKNGKPTE